MDYYEIKKDLRAEIMEAMPPERQYSDDEIMEIIESRIQDKSQEIYMSIVTRLTLKQELFNAIRRLDLLQELLDDENITEIMVNGGGTIFFEKGGQIYPWDKKFESVEKLEDVIQQIVSRSNRQVNTASPIVDARLEDGSRVNVVLKPVAIDGPILTIRKFSVETVTMDRLVRWGSLSIEVARFLEKLVIAGYNIFISGSTGSGKTTMLNALAAFIPSDERVITIEDSAELQIKGIENLVRLEVRNANSDGENEISIRDLIKSSLRMRPDRILVGEVRGPEAMDMLSAMNTGHDGSISTGHGNSVRDMMSRLETMVLMGTDIPLEAIRQQIASSLDIVIHLGRLRDKSRKVLEIAEIEGYENGEIIYNPLYRFEEQPVLREQGTYGSLSKNGGGFWRPNTSKVIGRLKPTGNCLKHVEKLLAAGLPLDTAVLAEPEEE